MIISKDYVRNQFSILDWNKDGHFYLEDYTQVLIDNPDFFDWYELFNHGGSKRDSDLLYEGLESPQRRPNTSIVYEE